VRSAIVYLDLKYPNSIRNLRNLLLSLLVINAGSAFTQSFSQLDKIVASDRRVLSHFGYSTSISGTFAIVGSFTTAYIFEKQTFGSWKEVKLLRNPDRVLSGFAHTVCISGSYAFVGAASMDEPDNNGVLMEEAGAVYIYERHPVFGWEFKHKIIASDRSSASHFGKAISASGDYIAVGAYSDDYDDQAANAMTDAGSVYIFKRNGSGDWIQIQKIIASDRSPVDNFGISVSLFENTLVVGASGDDLGNEFGHHGAAYFFDRDGNGIWTEAQKVTALNPFSYSGFGTSVGVSGSYAVMGNDGSQVAHIFERDAAGIWRPVSQISPSDKSPDNIFGGSISISGEIAVIGASWQQDQKQGAAYVYVRTDSGWVQSQKIVPESSSPGDEFGSALSLSDKNLLVGSFLDEKDEFGAGLLERAGSAYIFQLQEKKETPVTPVDSVERCLSFTRKFVIPNVITPNGDEFNQRFIVEDLFDRTSLHVFDRYGKLVFGTPDYHNTWEGDGLQAGIYYWTMIQHKDQCTEKLKGWVQIIR
jgi:gliding motility-associated-like protein